MGNPTDTTEEENKMANPKYETQVYTLYTYDLWGNYRDGYQVNDRFRQGTITLKVKGTVYNEGTDHEFVSYCPTDRQINRALRIKGVVWQGDDHTLYGETKNGKPVAELVREDT